MQLEKEYINLIKKMKKEFNIKFEYVNRGILTIKLSICNFYIIQENNY